MNRRSRGVAVRSISFRTPGRDKEAATKCTSFMRVSKYGKTVGVGGYAFTNPRSSPVGVRKAFGAIASVDSSEEAVAMRCGRRRATNFPGFFGNSRVRFVAGKGVVAIRGSIHAMAGISKPSKVNKGVNRNSKDLAAVGLALSGTVPTSIRMGRRIMRGVACAPTIGVDGYRFGRIPAEKVLMAAEGPVIVRGGAFSKVDVTNVCVSSSTRN